MKHALLVGPNYPPETNAAAKRMAAIAQHLVSEGWTVTVLTLLPHYPQNEIYDGFDVPTPSRSQERGVRVVRRRPWIVSRENLPLRFASEFVFCLRALWHIVSSPRPDVVMASSPYMFLGPLCLLGARLRRTRFVWELRDLTWEYAKATGKRSYGLDRAIESVMRLVARECDALVTATNGQLPYFDRRPRLSVVIPNGLTEEALRSLYAPRAGLRADEGRATVMYAGLLGYPQALSTLVDAAASLPGLEFVLVGDGPERPALEARAQDRGLANVRFTGYVSFDALLDHYARADIFVAHLRDSPEFAIAQPSKLWEYMATGKAVVFAGRGEAADILREHDIGLVVAPEDPEGLAAAIQSLALDPARRAALGARGRTFVMTHRRRSRLLGRLSEIFDELTRPP